MLVENREEVLQRILFQLCRINACAIEEAFKILSDAIALWTKRNKKKWTLKVAPNLVKTYPELKELPNFKPAETDYLK